MTLDSSPFGYDYAKAYEYSDYWEKYDWGGKLKQ